ncbi:MAG: hydroxymethylbilane synthase [Thermoguttaceae bacterium]
MSPLRLGTRASLLAQCQSQWVAAELQAAGIQVELVAVSTSGDQQQTPIGAIGATGVFTKEIERELLAGRVDLAVHSLKDLPTDVAAGLCLAAVPQRASVADALLSDKYRTLDQLPPGATVGTGSLRRRAQLLHARPDLQIRDIRGNVDTRLRKLHGGQVDAVVLAEAGLERLGLADQIAQRLPPAIMLPAVGQGALALEVRRDDRRTRQLVQALDHPASHAAVAAERAMLAALHGGCLAPVAAWGRFDQDRPDLLILTGRVLSPDGLQKIEATRSAPPAEAEQLGLRVADDLLAQGAAALIESARQ